MNTRLFRGAIALLAISALLACSKPTPASPPPEPESLSRTEFTDGIENFFEYEPLQAGKASQFLIHLTDLSDGSPVEAAQVTLTVRPRGGSNILTHATAKAGKVTGIYVAELTIPQAGECDIEFRIKNSKLDERLPLSDFEVSQP